MGRNLDTTLSTALGDGLIEPAIFVILKFASGTQYVWSGVGDFVFNGKTYQGVGNLGSVGAITEASAVKAEGTTVTLSGIGLSQVPIPDPGFTPPVTVLPGQRVVYAIPVKVGVDHFPPDAGGVIGLTGTVHTHTGKALNQADIEISFGLPLGDTSGQVTWRGFIAPALPVGAAINAIYPIATVASSGPSGISSPTSAFPSGLSAPNGSISLGSVGASLDALGSMTLTMEAHSSVFHGTSAIAATVGAAVYYSGPPPLTTQSLIYEAMNDIQIGAPAKIYFGLMSNGALLGAPYLVFSGTVDKPTVVTGPTSSSITLNLENRLINLQRPNQRRYTAADQHLFYPDDRAFNWVELLNDMSLKEGTA
jgi:hypothetical protein